MARTKEECLHHPTGVITPLKRVRQTARMRQRTAQLLELDRQTNFWWFGYINQLYDNEGVRVQDHKEVV